MLSGTHLWADRFDGSLEDIFELQDKVAVSVAGVIEPALQAAARSSRRPTKDLTAYDLYLRAYAMTLSSTRRVPEAIGLLERAIARDPHYAPALAWAAICCHSLYVLGEDPRTVRRKGVDFARRVLEVAGDDPGCLANAAFTPAYFGEDIGAMMALVDRALLLNPSFARGWALSANIRVWAGWHDTAIQHVESALRLSPRARVGASLCVFGMAHFFRQRFDEELVKLLLAIQEDLSHPPSYWCLAACYAHMGRLDEARVILAKLCTIAPAGMPTELPFRGPEDRELLLSGLRLAAGEG